MYWYGWFVSEHLSMCILWMVAKFLEWCVADAWSKCLFLGEMLIQLQLIEIYYNMYAQLCREFQLVGIGTNLLQYSVWTIHYCLQFIVYFPLKMFFFAYVATLCNPTKRERDSSGNPRVPWCVLEIFVLNASHVPKSCVVTIQRWFANLVLFVGERMSLTTIRLIVYKGSAAYIHIKTQNENNKFLSAPINCIYVEKYEDKCPNACSCYNKPREHEPKCD